MVSRRQFIGSASAGLTVATCWPQTARASSPVDQLRLGLIGCGVRGKYLVGNLPQEARVTAVCDFSDAQVGSLLQPTGDFREVLSTFVENDSRRVAKYRDYRRMIANEKLDGVIVATPDHHHVLAAALACEQGIDIYCEKPLSLTVREGQVLVKLVRKHGRVLQVGSQQRTMQVNRFACEWLRDGGLGRIHRVQIRNVPGPATLAVPSPEPVPKSMNWDLFCGPAPLAAYHRDVWVKDAYKRDGRLWRGWDLYRDFSGHLTTNWGGHSVDMVLMALGDKLHGPLTVTPQLESLDAKLMTRWQEKTPPNMPGMDAHQLLMRFCPIRVSLTDGPHLDFDPQVSSGVFHGEKGRMVLSRNRYSVEPADLAPPMDKAEAAKWDGAGHVARPHLQNWIDCIRTRDTPNAPVEVGHRTATICHLANLARQLGRALTFDPASESCPGDAEANGLLDRPRRRGFELPEV